MSGSTSLRNSLPNACSAVQRLLGSRLSMWSKRSRAAGGMLNSSKTAGTCLKEMLEGQIPQIPLTIRKGKHQLTKQTPLVVVAGTASLVSWC